MINQNKAKQTWNIGDTVKIGFLAGLVVIEIASIKDYLPDMYLLQRNEVFYRFIPHNGIERLGNHSEGWTL